MLFRSALEDLAGPFSMGFWIWGGDEEVVHVDDEPSFGDHVPEGVIHESLERGGGVAKAEEHDCWFEESFVCDECRLPLVAVFDAYIVVPPSNVKLGEVASVFQLVHEVGNKGEGVGVTGGMFVEIPVILARTKFSIFLFDEEERGCLGGVGRTNLPSGKVFFEEVLGRFLFVGRKRVDFAYFGHKGFVKIDLVEIGRAHV